MLGRNEVTSVFGSDEIISGRDGIELAELDADCCVIVTGDKEDSVTRGETSVGEVVVDGNLFSS